MRKLVLIAGLVAFSFPAIGQDTPMRVTPDALTWKDNPAFPKGVQIATLVGDPTKAGDVVVLRIKFPPNFQMPPHTHPYSEVVTIISGNIGADLLAAYLRAGIIAGTDVRLCRERERHCLALSQATNDSLADWPKSAGCEPRRRGLFRLETLQPIAADFG
jgi:hypothetical protein